MKRATFGFLGAVSVMVCLLCFVNAASLLDSIVGSGGDKESSSVLAGFVILLLGSLYASVYFFRRASTRKN